MSDTEVSVPADVIPKLEILGVFFQLPNRYTEGHVCTQAEAVALNIARRENLRAVFSKVVKKALPETGLPTEEVVEKLQAEFAGVAESYTFTKTTTKTSLDPIEKKARELATELAESALKTQGIVKSQLKEGVFEAFVEDIVRDNPDVMEEARSRVEMERKMASGLAAKLAAA